MPPDAIGNADPTHMASVTCSIQSTTLASSASWMAMCCMAVSGAARSTRHFADSAKTLRAISMALFAVGHPA